MKKLVCFAAAAALIGLVHAASGQSAPSAAAVKKAAEEFSMGKQAYRDGAYLEAAEHFEAADDSAPSVNALRAAMTSRSKAGQLDRAATLASLALERHPEDENLAVEAREILDQADAELQRISVTCDFPCSLVVGTSLIHGAPAEERTIYLAPGPHELRASWSEDETRTELVDGLPGGVLDVAFLRPEMPPEDDVPDVDPTRDDYDDFGDQPQDVVRDADRDQHAGLPPAVFAVGAVATLGLGGVTVWSGINTIEDPGKDTVAKECQTEGTECELYKQGQRKELRTNILIGATGVVGVATIIIGAVATDWTGRPKSDAGRRRRVEPWVSVGQGAAIGARGRF